MNVDVAKAIGWRVERREDNDYADGGRSVWVWDQWVDAAGNDVGRYTVDDLLAWLRSVDRDHLWPTAYGCYGYAKGGRTGVDDWTVEIIDDVVVSAPTLLEALEQAVLAVAGGES